MKILKQTAGMLAFLAAFLLITACVRQAGEKISFTTSSEKALELYEQAIAEMENVRVSQSHDLLKKALAEDSAFFRAAYQLAVNSLSGGDKKAFARYAEKALAAGTDLGKGEKLMRDVLEKLYNDSTADVVTLIKPLMEMFPADKEAYYQVATFQFIKEDYEGVKATALALLEITDNQAPVYNMLGYAYMNLDDLIEAEKAFDRYIELVPAQANPYDSKGDYFMETKQYEKAYESFRKAFEIDSTFTISRDKAAKAKEIVDSLAASIIPE